MKRHFLILLAMVMMLPICASASFVEGGKREFPILCNGIPCVLDSANLALYCSIKPEAGDSIKLVFTSESITQLRINYHRYNMGDTVTLYNDLRRAYRLNIGTNYQRWTIYFTSLPMVMVEAAKYEKEVYNPGYIYIIDPWKRTKGQALFQHYIGARIRGASTSGYPKKPYAIKLWDANREGKNVSVMGLMKDDNLILDAMYNDKARMRTRLCFDLWNQVDSLPYNVSEGHSKLNGTVGRFVEVFVDGSYNGLYCLTDKINRKKLDLAKTATDDNGKTVFHGMLYKATDWSAETRFNDVRDYISTENTLEWCNWEQKYPDDSVEMANWAPLKNLITFTAPATNSNKVKFAALLRNKYYLQNLTDFILFVNVLHINDNNCKNTYVSYRDVKDVTPQALLTPWDLDASFGRDWNSELLNVQGFGSQVTSCGLFDRLLNGGPAYFRQNFRDTWIRWKSGAFSLDSVRNRIMAYKDLLYKSGAWKREMLRWPNSMGAIDTETNYMVSWYARAIANADSVLADFPSAINDVVVNPANDVSILVQDNMVVVKCSDLQAQISIWSVDGAEVENQNAAIPYRSRVLEKGVYVVCVKTAHTTARKKVLIR